MTAHPRMRYELDDYNAWRTMFDKHPLDRKGSGATGYRISRDVANDAAVLVDLEFGTVAQAEAFRDRLRDLLADPSTPKMARADVVLTETTKVADI
jgi:hypothetical protein